MMTECNPLVAGLEMGGTKCVLTLARGPQDIVDQAVVPTGHPLPTIAAIEAQLDRWRAGPGFDAIGIAAFGPLQLDPRRADFGAIVATAKPGWSGVNVFARIAARYEIPVALQTDVNGAALAEGRWGGAQGLTSHGYITIGTGVGVGLVVAGRPLVGLTHGELGHIRVRRAPGDDFAGICPFHGDCVEGLISGPAIAARTGRPGQDIPIDDPSWAVFEQALAELLHMIVLTLAPERIAIGGGVVAGRPALFDGVRRRLTESLNGYGATDLFVRDIATRLGPPLLGDLAGPLGAVAVALEATDIG